MNKTDMLVKRIRELSDENKRDLVWQSMDEETKGTVRVLIEKLAVIMNE